MRDRAFLAGLPVDLSSRKQLTELLREWLSQPRQSRQIVTLNVNMLMLAFKNDRLFRVIREADLVTADGAGIARALQRRHYPVERITGLDLTRQLLQISAREGYSVYFYGGGARICEKLAAQLSRQYPGLLIQAVRDGYGLGCSAAMIREELRAAPPRLLLVGMGTPAQELFLKDILPFLPGTVGMGVGGVLEILAGCQNQAPRLIRDHGLEWLFRMMQEPRRLNRLPDLIRFWWSEIRRR